MKDIPHVHLTYYDKNPHISQIISGFLMLAEQKKIKLKISGGKKTDNIPHLFLVVAEIGKNKIAFDVLDGYDSENWNINKMTSYLKTVDFYFKRSYSEKNNIELGYDLYKKIYPLGFNYHVSFSNNPIDVPDGYLAKIKSYRDAFLHKSIEPYFNPGRFEVDLSDENDNGKILFMARLWDPDKENTFPVEELEYINSMRINIICKLRKQYGDNFIGGIIKDEYSLQMCPDIVLDDSLTDRKAYVGCMKQSHICIGSIGLHESIGWKTGEYVAASRAIVNERFHYEVPEFIEGRNYIPFETEEECLSAVDYLWEHPDEVIKMQYENQQYYEKFLRPDKLIENALNMVLNGLK